MLRVKEISLCGCLVRRIFKNGDKESTKIWIIKMKEHYKENYQCFVWAINDKAWLSREPWREK